MNMKPWSHAVAMGLGILALATFASEPHSQKEEQNVTVEATITAINQQTREVTLKTDDGSVMVIKAGPEVKRLDEIRKGDGVELTYHEALAMTIIPAAAGAKPDAAMVEASGRAPDEESPAAAEGRQIDAIVEITAIDKNASTVDIKGPEGNVVTVHARHPENLEKIKVGDMVHIAYTQAVAIKIVPKAKR